MKHGTVRFDNWVLPSKIVDLPCIIESHKTLDKKNFYKTADICQMMICSEDIDETRDQNDKKIEGKDGKDKRFNFPHGITPPLKNVRKKRFRKTLKKKTVDVPEIEKEVKCLFRSDMEAISVRYEVVDADDEKTTDSVNKTNNNNAPSPGTNAMINNNSQSMEPFNLVEHDLFGQVLSSSDDEDTRAQESDDLSRLSMGLSNKGAETSTNAAGNYITEFSKDMLMSTSTNIDTQQATTSLDDVSKLQLEQPASSGNFEMMASESVDEAVASLEIEEEKEKQDDSAKSNNDLLRNKLSIVEIEIADIEEKLRAQEQQIASIENFALQQRLQKEINDLKTLEQEKRKEHADLLSMLNG